MPELHALRIQEKPPGMTAVQFVSNNRYAKPVGISAVDAELMRTAGMREQLYNRPSVARI